MKERKKEMIVMKKKKEREKDSTPNTTNICTVCGKKMCGEEVIIWTTYL